MNFAGQEGIALEKPEIIFFLIIEWIGQEIVIYFLHKPVARICGSIQVF